MLLRDHVLSYLGDQEMSARTLAYRTGYSYNAVADLVRKGDLEVVSRLKPEHPLQRFGVPVVRARKERAA